MQHKRLPTQCQPCNATGNTDDSRTNTPSVPVRADTTRQHNVAAATTWSYTRASAYSEDAPRDYGNLHNICSNHVKESSAELPSCSKRRRCAVQLQIGCAVRHEKSLPLFQPAAEDGTNDSRTVRQPPRGPLLISGGRPPDNNHKQASTNHTNNPPPTPPTPPTTPPRLVIDLASPPPLRSGCTPLQANSEGA